MADVDINKFRASVVRDGSKPASPGFIVSEGQDPVDPAGNGQNHLPVTIATAATGLSITDSQVLGGAGTVGQYIRGDGSLADFPQASGGGSSVSYYLNGSISQGTIGGVAYKELNKVPILGAGTDFTINANGYIASFLTDAGDPNLLEIPGGNWNFETYFSASSSGGTPSFYVELYKYDGTTFTLIASSSSSPELIAFGTNLNPYFSTLAVPTTTLALTDRLAVRFYVTHSGRTITLHTENNHLCQVVTTFTTGLTSLNGLTAQVQNLAVGTSGTDFNIASATATHTFNLPTASATNRGALSSADWTIFNNKQNALGYVPVPETRTITINGVSQDLSANRIYNVGTVTSVGLSSATSGVTIGGSPVTGVGAFTLAIATASGSQNGLLSSTDWTTFNSKQNALTNPVTGTGSAGQIAYFSGTSAITSESGLTWDATNNNLSIGGVTANSNLTVSGSDNTNIFTVLSGLNSRLHVGTVTSPNNDVYIRSQNNYALNLGVNNTNYLTILNSGNIGINTATPSQVLEVNGTGLFTGSGLSGNTKNGVYIYDQAIISLAGTNPRDLQIQAQNLRFFTGTTYGEKLRIFTDGNVLIQDGGTFTNNGARLQVSGNGFFSGSYTTIQPSTNTNSAYNEFLNFGGYGYIGLNSSTGGNLAAGTPAYAMVISTYKAGGLTTPIQFAPNNSIAMTITSSGNVGIGDTNPTSSAGWTPRLVLNATSAALVVKGINGQENTFGTSNGLYIDCLGNSTGTNNNIIFRTSNSNSSFSASERMRITSGGEILFNTQSNSATSGAGFKILSNGEIPAVVTAQSTDGGRTSYTLYSTGAGAFRFYVGAGGTIFATSTSISAISDSSLKTNIRNLDKGLDEIMKLKPRRFDWINGDSDDVMGFIAQEVEEVFPELIGQYSYNETETKKSLKMGDLLPSLVKAIQELKTEIDTLKN